MADKHTRSLVKALSWRLTGSLDTMIISFVVTGRLTIALSITGVELFTKVGLYYVHERIWDKIPAGRHAPPAGGAADDGTAPPGAA